ncbi:glutathione S-transferase A-like [Syngnathoides biaculeatus]|uniref:glutathione S-transferase A-like n=1 Tax=Syngnathoides biaculeatus TaxID=300417 RepID=UPI002ADE5EF4|nr:glutathione S-transferase A-like [Syngnathoides biaculeatus]
MEIVLYWGEGSPPCWRVLIALQEKQCVYSDKLLSFDKMEHKSPAVLAINPRGQLPTFKHGNRIVNESTGACLYLENEFKGQGTQLIPTSHDDQAMMFQRIFEANVLAQKLVQVLYYDWRVPQDERHDSAKARNASDLREELKLWEGYMEKASGGFMAGKSFSMADVIVYPYVAFSFYHGLSPTRFPKLAQYHDMLKDRPSIKKTWPSIWEQNTDKLKDI